MATIVPASLVNSISGRVNRRETAYFATMKHNGQVYVSHYPKKKERTSDRQKAMFQAFGSRSRLASQWLNVNKPTPDNPMGTEAFQQMRKEFESQRKIGVWFSFVMKHLRDDFEL